MLQTMNLVLLVATVSLLPCIGCGESPSASDSTDILPPSVAVTSQTETKPAALEAESQKMQKVTFGAGCFWCIEAVLDRIKGVESVVSGYMGGNVVNPTYEQVCTGTTNHAEVVEVTYDPELISFDKLMDVFWQLHDPTTLNRQGFDVGTQYRSAVFYHTPEQREIAEASKKKWNASGKFKDPIVTEITAASVFYPAETYHQEYFSKNPRDRYCRVNILPKFKKLGLLRDTD